MALSARTTAAAIVALAMSLAALPAAAQTKLKFTCTETPLGEIVPGARDAVFSPDGKHVAYAINRQSTWTVMMDGREVKQYPWVVGNTLRFSPDSQHFAFVAQRGADTFLVLDGAEGKPYRDITSPTFSPDSKRLAYIAKLTPTAKGRAVVLDGVPSKEYDSPRSLVFSRDGKHFAFAITATGGKHRWIIDGTEQELFDSLGPLAMSADGGRIGYIGQRGEQRTIIIDGKEIKTYDLAAGLAFSADGAHVLYVVQRMIEDDITHKPVRKLFVVRDGVEGKPYDLLGEPRFSPDGLHVAYPALLGKLWRVVEDGKEHEGLYDLIDDLAYSADGKHVVYRTAAENRQRVIVDQKPEKEFDMVDTPVISADGSGVAYKARDGVEECVIFNGRQLPGVRYLALSPDGRYLACADTRQVDGKLMKMAIVVNGADCAVYDGVLAGSALVWDGNDRFYAMAGRDRQIIRVEVKVSPQ